jgi:hypothetical protein
MNTDLSQRDVVVEKWVFHVCLLGQFKEFVQKYISLVENIQFYLARAARQEAELIFN